MFSGSAAQNMDFISPNSPAYYLTSVTKDRLSVFRLDTLKSIASAALSEARESGGFLILAYVIMPDHFHVITDSEKKASVIQRFINGITSRRVIGFCEKGWPYFFARKAASRRVPPRPPLFALGSSSKCSAADERGDVMQRVHYTHQNPVRLGLVERAEDYRFSSVRIWNSACQNPRR